MDVNFDEIIEDVVVADEIQEDTIGSEEMMVVAGIKDVKVNGESVVKANVANINVPTKVSELNNDAEFIDKTVNNLLHYYLKTETYSKTEINNIVGNINSFNVLIVEALPTENISTTTIYLMLTEDGEGDNYYKEYLYINNSWEMIGTTQLKLEPATEKTFGTVRVWEEDGYICLSTEPWVAFKNVQAEKVLTIQGSAEISQVDSVVELG